MIRTIQKNFPEIEVIDGHRMNANMYEYKTIYIPSKTVGPLGPFSLRKIPGFSNSETNSLKLKAKSC